ncbi:hypothetical protein ACWEPC_02050 [Nonomuraea sp. NPDC004297]
MAWWGDGWGVWPGSEPDLATPPAYSTRNITHAAMDAATSWAVGTVPADPAPRVRCSFGGDPDGETKFLARTGRRRRWPF